ncbi:MAG: DUF1003 domain-containing protein [Patescibacteria group bacterium]
MTLNWHQKHQAERTLSERFSDMITSFVGSWPFVILHILWFGAWLFFKIEKFPYGLLTMSVSLEAIFLTTFVMMSQNRQAQRDRIQAEADYATNVKAKEEIEDIQHRLARIENEKLEKILTLLEKR